jgi:GTP cyclohydrolase I
MSYNKLKIDPVLGKEVHEYLVKLGVETPMNDAVVDGISTVQMLSDGTEVLLSELTRDVQISMIELKFKDIMMLLKLDLTDDSLNDTPKRVAKMFVNEIFWGLDYASFPKCTTIENKMSYNEMVVERNVNVQSNCEHHFVVIDGYATVGYIPNKVVLGLSKINRVVEYFAKRPQVQERLTEQVFHALEYILGTDNIAVVIDAKHYCVAARGVEDTGSTTVTSKLGGAFKNDPTTRSEFMSIVNK